MGHANVSNLSRFFVRRLYAKGTLSTLECAQALVRAGEKLQASEGAYEDQAMLLMGLMDVVHYLTRDNPAAHGYSGPHFGGPWIEPAWTPFPGQALAGKLSATCHGLLCACAASPDDTDRHKVASDRLNEEGFPDWARHVRALPGQRLACQSWVDEGKTHQRAWEDMTDGEDLIFDLVRWRFVGGWRQRYREVPLLANVTH